MLVFDTLLMGCPTSRAVRSEEVKRNITWWIYKAFLTAA